MPYTGAGLNHLDTLLGALPQDQFPMAVSELNGYLTGVLASRSLIPPSEWLPGIWSEGGQSDFPDLAMAEATITAVMNHYKRFDTVIAAAAAAVRTLCFMTPTPTIMVRRYKTTRTIARRFPRLSLPLACFTSCTTVGRGKAHR